MNAANPYESPSTKSQSRARLPVDLFVAGLWLAIPIGAYVGRQLLLPVFRDFGVELPIATVHMLRLSTHVLLATISVAVLLMIFSTPEGKKRRLFVLVAIIAGVVVGSVYLLSLLLPFLSLWHNLN